MGCRPRARSVLHCHGVWGLRQSPWTRADGTVCAPPRRPAPPTPPWPAHAACSRSALLHSLPQHGPHLPSFSNPSCILQHQLPYRPSSAARARRPSDRSRWSAHASTTCNTRSRHGSLSIYLASRTTSTGPCQPSLSLSLYRLGDRRSHSHMLMHCFSCQHAQKIWDDKLWCWLSCRIMHWISLVFSLMLCTPISQTQHRAVEAALSSSKIAFTLQIASLQRLYRSFCPVWFCTYFASTSIYHGNMTLQCPGVGGRGRSPLIPAMPRRVVVAAKHSFSYPGARPCRRPSPKILQPAGVFTFLGVRGGKKEGKIWRCVLEVLVGRFLVDFWPIFHNFLVLSTRKNRVIYNVFVPLASKKSFWQHAKNCVNTSVFARPGPQNIVNTVIFASRGSKPRKYRGFALARSQKHRYLRCIFVPRMWKIAKTPPIWRFLGVRKNRRFDDFEGFAKSTNYKDNNDNDNRTKQQQL